MDGRVLLRIVAALVLLGAIAGIGVFAYTAGLATQAQVPANATGQPPYPSYGYGYWHPWPFFGFGCFGPLLGLLLVFLALRAFSFLFWGPRWGRWGHWGMHRAWRPGGYEEGDVPPMFKEWHDRAHGAPAGQPPQENDKS